MGRRDREDKLFETLSNARRRTVIEYIAEHGPTSKSDLAEKVMDEHDCGRKNAMVGLHQVHLPKMCDLGAITYDSRSGRVSEGELLDDCVTVMNVVGEDGSDALRRARVALGF